MRVLMGNVVYQIPDNDSRVHTTDGIVLLADIGEVSINPGREFLSLDAPTVDWLKVRLHNIVDEVHTAMYSTIAALPTLAERMKAAIYYYNVGIKYYDHYRKDEFMIMNAAAIEPAGPVVITSHGFFNKPSGSELKSKYSYYKSARTADSVSIRDLYRNPIYINDTIASIVDIYPYISSSHEVFIFHKAVGTTLDTFVTTTTSYLDDLGLSYTLYSKHITAPTRATKTASRTTEVTINTIISEYQIAAPTVIRPSDSTYYYLPISGTTFIDSATKVAALLCAHTLLSTVSTIPKLVGLNKRSLELVSENPNFILFESIVQSLLDQHTFITLPTPERSAINYIANPYSSFTNPPPILSEVYQLRNTITRNSPRDHTVRIDNIKPFFHLKYVTITSPLTIKEMDDRFPLYRLLQRTPTQEHLDHYLKLELHYDSTCPPSRQHTYTDTATSTHHDYTLPTQLLADTSSS